MRAVFLCLRAPQELPNARRNEIILPTQKNALQRLPEGAFLYLLKEVMNWRRISDTQKLL